LNPYASRRRNLKPGEEQGNPSESKDSRGFAIDGEATEGDESAARPRSAAASDPVEAALAKALTEASEAGRFDVVALLAGELRARRLARGSVVTLDARRRQRGE